jgi:hypothetical protein
LDWRGRKRSKKKKKKKGAAPVAAAGARGDGDTLLGIGLYSLPVGSKDDVFQNSMAASFEFLSREPE